VRERRDGVEQRQGEISKAEVEVRVLLRAIECGRPIGRRDEPRGAVPIAAGAASRLAVAVAVQIGVDVGVLGAVRGGRRLVVVQHLLPLTDLGVVALEVLQRARDALVAR